MSGTRVQVVVGGPVLVAGPVSIEMPDGEVVESDRFMVAICTCRRSDNYPLCDTSHRRCRNLSRRTPSPAPSATTSDPAATTP
ncbi:MULTISPECIES: CDGSH iron-sulfur domain-containing protein [unclassified Mycobacterium]|uniref:CDGSH iron-sulfur domain-containing protein n=1 Tax=unclassified Mycobacterium TaxID=2642494 RepID=UPI0009EE0313|nr:MULTISPECIES: CDGSH iron-sulfur domain-containing protein [unclassified Mycobacterium]